MRLRDPTLVDSDVEQLRLFTNWLLDMGDGRLPFIALDGEDGEASLVIPNHKLELKVRVPIILFRNLNMQCCDKVLIHRIDMTPTNSSWPFQFRRRQFPVKVCFDVIGILTEWGTLMEKTENNAFVNSIVRNVVIRDLRASGKPLLTMSSSSHFLLDLDLKENDPYVLRYKLVLKVGNGCRVMYYVFFNQYARNLLGVSVDDLINKAFTLCVYPSSLVLAADNVADVIGQQKFQHGEDVPCHKDKSHYIPIKDSINNSAGSLTDLSEVTDDQGAAVVNKLVLNENIDVVASKNDSIDGVVDNSVIDADNAKAEYIDIVSEGKDEVGSNDILNEVADEVMSDDF
ncbi:ATP-dependent DNA helicase PIF1-like protein [Tanacetum coccineum]